MEEAAVLEWIFKEVQCRFGISLNQIDSRFFFSYECQLTLIDLILVNVLVQFFGLNMADDATLEVMCNLLERFHKLLFS